MFMDAGVNGNVQPLNDLGLDFMQFGPIFDDSNPDSIKGVYNAQLLIIKNLFKCTKEEA